MTALLPGTVRESVSEKLLVENCLFKIVCNKIDYFLFLT